MAENTLVEKVEEELNCAICLNTYINPKILQCHHAYCQVCLERLVPQGQQCLTCPCCCAVTPMPEGGVAALQSAFQANTLVDILKLDTRYAELFNQREEIEADMHVTFRQLHQALEERKAKLMRRLDEVTKNKLKGLAAQKEQLELRQARLTSWLEFIQSNLKMASEKAMLAMKADLLEQVKELVATCKPGRLELQTWSFQRQ